MKVAGQHFRTIWLKPDDPRVVQIIDQTALPHRFVVEDVTSVEQMATAIREMHVRGAGLIGAAAGYGMYLAALAAAKTGDFDREISKAAAQLKNTRPTAVNLAWAIERQLARLATDENIKEKIAARTRDRAADRRRRCRTLPADRPSRLGIDPNGLRTVKPTSPLTS